MNDYNKVIVTGGSGFVGKRLQIHKPEWTYLSSKDLDLMSLPAIDKYLKLHKPDAIIHLAAKVGGILHNVNNQSDFYYYNSNMGANLLRSAFENNIPRVISALSTCCYPDVCDTYPMTEEQYLKDLPTYTNYGYGLSKRNLYTQTNFYREVYGLNYSTFTPCNIYGPEANFTVGESHFIASLIRKIHECKDGNIELFGTGKPLRQHIYVDDLVKIIPILLDEHNSDVPINIAPNENLSINAHTLLLVDIGLSLKDALKQLEIASNKTLKKIIIISRAGTKNKKIIHNTISKLKNYKAKEPFSIIIPAKLSYGEKI